jgi:predicted metal-dependent phosphoesterase TrpH
MPKLMIDLHTHTTFSDGTSTPETLLQEASAASLRALAITDHDTFAGFDAALPLAPSHGLELICGLELSTQLASRTNGRKITVHLLGYFLNQTPTSAFRDWLQTVSSTRWERNLKLMASLRAQNLAIDWSDLPLSPQLLSRTHFAGVLVAKGYVPDPGTAFDLYLSDQVLRDVDRSLPTLEEGIEKISKAGGLPSLAHPVRLPFREPQALRSFLHDLAGCGLHGLEAYHSDHSSEDTRLFLELARDFDLVVTGGSDYHGVNKPNIFLGKGRGNLSLAYRLLEKMKTFAGDRLPSR